MNMMFKYGACSWSIPLLVSPWEESVSALWGDAALTQRALLFLARLTNLHRRAVFRPPPEPALKSASPWRRAAGTKWIACWGDVLRCYLLQAHGCFPFKSMAQTYTDILTISSLCCVRRYTVFDFEIIHLEWATLAYGNTHSQTVGMSGNSGKKKKE